MQWKDSTAQRVVIMMCGLMLAGGAWTAEPVAVDQAAGPATAPAMAGGLPAQLQDFDAYVQSVRKRFDVPGIAVVIVKDGRVVLERGYGIRELGKSDPVDENTLFAIASNTKAFTAASLSMLADEGKLSLDDRVIDHLPWFQMSDAFITREMRVRDLLAHRSGLGLGAGDLLYWPDSDYSTREVAERLRYVPLSGSFRGQYAYDNILYGVAQLVIEQASGQTYQTFLQQRIFDPLGMKSTRYNYHALKPTDRNVATGHAKVNFAGALETVPRTAWANMSGAGGIYSSVHDMSQWMRVQLAGGVISGQGDDAQRLFSEKRQRAMWSMVTPINVGKATVPELESTVPNFMGYGEGWYLSDYRGEKLVWHTGGWPGMVSKLTMVPGRNLGVMVLTSGESGGAFNAVTLRVLDAYLGASKSDWSAVYGAALDLSRSKADDSWQKHVAARVNSQPSLPLSGYAATYRDPWYGDVLIRQEGKALVMRFSRTQDLVGTLEHWQHDTFIVRWTKRWLNADAWVNFALTEDGAVREMTMKAVSPLTDFSFDFHDLRLKPVKPDKPESQ